MNFRTMLLTAMAALLPGSSQPTPKPTYKRRALSGVVSKTFVSINAPHKLDEVDVGIITDDLLKRFQTSHYPQGSGEPNVSWDVKLACYGSMMTNPKQTTLVVPAEVSAKYIKRRKGTAAKQGGEVIGTTSKWEWIYAGSN